MPAAYPDTLFHVLLRQSDNSVSYEAMPGSGR